VSWRVAWGVASDRPLTGGGFWVLPHREIFARYAPGYPTIHSAHSIYFAVLGDHGFPGLFVFVSLILSCVFTLIGLEWRLRQIPEGARLRSYCQMVLASFVVYAVSGAFLTQAYWDLFYHLVAFVILLKAIAQREGFLERGRREEPSAKSAAPSVKSVSPTLPALPVTPQVRRTRAQRIVR
jgi:O-antigen ligase